MPDNVMMHLIIFAQPGITFVTTMKSLFDCLVQGVKVDF